MGQIPRDPVIAPARLPRREKIARIDHHKSVPCKITDATVKFFLALRRRISGGLEYVVVYEWRDPSADFVGFARVAAVDRSYGFDQWRTHGGSL